MMKTYLGDDADGLDGLEFLTMAEAGELGHVEIMGRMNEKAGNPAVQELVEWALPDPAAPLRGDARGRARRSRVRKTRTSPPSGRLPSR